MRRQAEAGVAKAWPYPGMACEYTCDETMVAWQEAIAQAGVAYRPGRATIGSGAGAALRMPYSVQKTTKG